MKPSNEMKNLGSRNDIQLGLRFGEKSRAQMFEIESAKISPFKGEENFVDIESTPKSGRKLIGFENAVEIYNSTKNQNGFIKNWAKIILIMLQVKRYFKLIQILSHPEQLTQLQIELINDLSAKGVEDGWGEVEDAFSNTYKHLPNKNKQLSRWGKLQNNLRKIPLIQILRRHAVKAFKNLNQFFASKVWKCITHAVPLIDSQKNVYLVWDILISLISITSSVYLPFEMAFIPRYISSSDDRYIIQSIILYVFVINSIIQMNLSYFDKNCRLITDKNQIFLHYVKTFLIGDSILIASLVIFENYYRATTYSVRTALFFWRIVYRNSNIGRILDQIFYTDYWKAIRNLFTLFLQILFCCHVFACYFFLLGDRSKEQEGKSWLTVNESQMNNNIYSQYINSFYFAVVTMSTIGYGDIAPITDSQQLFMIFMSLFASMLFGYTINSLASIFSEYDQKQLEFTMKNEELTKYFRQHNIQPGLQYRSKKYLEFIEKEGINQNQSSMCLDYLSPFLKEEILKRVSFYTINQIQFLHQNFSSPFLRALSRDIKERIFVPDEPILVSKTRSEPAIYFIHQGKIELFVQAGQNFGENIRSLGVQKEGDVFGLREFCQNSEDVPISIRSQGISVIHVITLEDFKQNLREFPGDQEIFADVRDRAVFNSECRKIGEYCFSCHSPNHQTLKCPRIDYCCQNQMIISRAKRNFESYSRNFQRKKNKQNINSRIVKNNLNQIVDKFRIEQIMHLLLYESEYLLCLDILENDESLSDSRLSSKLGSIFQKSEDSNDEQHYLSFNGYTNPYDEQKGDSCPDLNQLEKQLLDAKQQLIPRQRSSNIEVHDSTQQPKIFQEKQYSINISSSSKAQQSKEPKQDSQNQVQDIQQLKIREKLVVDKEKVSQDSNQSFNSQRDFRIHQNKDIMQQSCGTEVTEINSSVKRNTIRKISNFDREPPVLELDRINNFDVYFKHGNFSSIRISHTAQQVEFLMSSQKQQQTLIFQKSRRSISPQQQSSKQKKTTPEIEVNSIK